MKRINFTMSITCTDEQFQQPDTQNLISDQWKNDLIDSAGKSGFNNVVANWEVEELN